MIEARLSQNLGSALALATERVALPVEAMHRVISGRWLGPLGAIAEPVRSAHDTLMTAGYESVRLGAAAVGYGVDQMITVDPETAGSVQAFVN
ncbi:MAG: hypothetical protein U9R51_06195, partial [Actinomycetota bacterium]|nr:hypothetical protein [Actinomycetota bacterium]